MASLSKLEQGKFVTVARIDEVSEGSMLGVAVLLGLVGKNAILLVDRTDRLRRSGDCADHIGAADNADNLAILDDRHALDAVALQKIGNPLWLSLEPAIPA